MNLEQWAKQVDLSELEDLLYKASDSYYNSGTSIISDSEYDELFDVLKERNNTSDLINQVGAIDPKGKVKLPYYMGSLTKIKTEKEILSWKKNYKNDIIITEKLDGVSLQIIYENETVNIFTRGDGVYGRNISHIIKHINLPKLNINLALRAEIIIPKDQFESLYVQSNYSDSFNLRNYVSGLINRIKDEPTELKNSHVVAYEIIDSNENLENQLKTLQQLGFKIPQYKILNNNFIIDELSEILNDWKIISKYDIDGIVITNNTPYIRNIDKNPEYSFAFKQLNNDNIAIVKVIDVEWNISRHGILKPVLIVEPTKLSGVMVNRVTAHNGNVIYSQNIGVGSKVKITRSGDVIPYLLEVVECSEQPSMPNESWKWNDTKIDIIYTGNDKRNLEITRLEYFFSTIGVEKMKVGIISKIYDAGFNTIKKIIFISIDELIQIDGIQNALANTIRENIDKAIQNLTLDVLMNASGIFDIGIGKKRCEQIIRNYPNFLEYDSANKLEQDLLKLNGFSDIIVANIISNYEDFKSFYSMLGVSVKSVENEKSSILNNMCIVFSGFRNKTFEDIIISNGGIVGSSVSKNTYMLVVDDVNKKSSKLEKARQLNVKICDKSDFIKFLTELKVKN